MATEKQTPYLEDFDLMSASIFSNSGENRVIRVHNKLVKTITINFRKQSPQDIESALKKLLKYGCSKGIVARLKADYHVWNMVQERMRLSTMVMIAEQIESPSTQLDGSLLTETDLAKLDLALAKCEGKQEIAMRFGINESVVDNRELEKQQSIIDLRRRLNAELEDSTIGLAHDFVRLSELQESIDIIKAHMTDYEDVRTRKDLSAEEKMLRMSQMPNIISLINAKEKIISSAQKEMKSRKEDAIGQTSKLELSKAEKDMYQYLHQELPLLELVVGRASADNGWDTSYMIAKLNQSIYKKFRKGEYGDDYEMATEKDLNLAYPSEQPVDLDEVISQTEGRDNDAKMMTPRDINKTPEELSKGEIIRARLQAKLKAKKDGEADISDTTDS